MESGPLNAITDVTGVGVGHSTIIAGRQHPDGRDRRCASRRRLGREAVFAAPHRLNGNGEMTGLEWVRESGLLTTPIAITNTHSVGAVHEALIAHEVTAAAG